MRKMVHFGSLPAGSGRVALLLEYTSQTRLTYAIPPLHPGPSWSLGAIRRSLRNYVGLHQPSVGLLIDVQPPARSTIPPTTHATPGNTFATTLLLLPRNAHPPNSNVHQSAMVTPSEHATREDRVTDMSDAAYPQSDATATDDDGNNYMAMADSAEPQINIPPPHLAARFYRNRANARRKSSAASSRRNSLSSVQSHASSRSHRRSSAIGLGGQSNYIAQHLRRNSILESRKARLADRAAHVEQVRLRAALAKSAPRGSISTSEERALAAQVAKEKYLAKVAATCAEEVARAKRVAEEVKERKLAEEARVRLEMEEKYAEVEKRRAEFQRNLQARRARRADSSEKKLAVVDELADGVDEEVIAVEPVVLDRETASRRIQRAWRVSRRRPILFAFTKQNLNVDSALATDFEDMTARIAEPSVIRFTTDMLTQLGLQEAHDKNAALNTRTFLSAYLIVAHSDSTLNSRKGAQETDLINKASDLLRLFEENVNRLALWNSYTPHPTHLEDLSQAYSRYTSAFAAWRLQDSSVLIEGMVASFVELDAIWQTVENDSRGEVSAEYREGIRDNQVMLLSRIRKLAGPERADLLIKKAIRESRKRKPKGRKAAEIRPRGVEPGVIDTSESDSQLVENDKAADAAVPSSNPPSSDITRRLFTNLPSNRVLTHELAIDKDYRLTHSESQTAMRDEVYRTVCEAMKAGFEAGEGKLWTLSAAENIREKLLRMLKPGNSMHIVISDTLDLEQIARQCHAGIFSYDGFFDFMANILPKLCAPYRDEEIAAVCQILRAASGGPEVETMIDKLFKLLRAVDMLSLDYSNFVVSQAAPVLIREAAGYERRQFSTELGTGQITLHRTRRWWRAAYNTLCAGGDRYGAGGSTIIEHPGPDKIYVKALADLAIEQGLLEDTEVPETLHLDTSRLCDIRVKAARITVVGAILLTAKNLLKRDVRAQWKTEAARLWTLLANISITERVEADADADTVTICAQKAFGVLETAHNMPPSSKTQLAGTIRRFFSQAAAVSTNATARFTDPVLKVLFQRLHRHILERLSASTSVERIRAATEASGTLTSWGLGEMMPHVGAIVDVLDRMRSVDWQSHEEWYTLLAREATDASRGAQVPRA
nr:t-complex protein 11-like protein 1 [Quercus suber]